MKSRNLLGAMLLATLMSCGGNPSESFITIDVTESYPKKEMLLQDIANVEYIPLETSDEFLVTSVRGKIADIGDNIIILTNTRQGDIMIFDRKTGKGIKKINHKGPGPEEYVMPFNVRLNKEQNLMYVNDGPSSKIQVYDLEGNHQRTIKYSAAIVMNLINYDEDYFLMQDIYAYGNEQSTHTFYLMSKQDGNQRKNIDIPYEKRISPFIVKVVESEKAVYSATLDNSFISSYNGDWILTEPSADTIYRHTPNEPLRPFIVRTPSVQTMSPEVFLFPGILTDQYYFMQAVTKEADVLKGEEMPTVDLVYDTKEKQTYRYVITNADYEEREEDFSVAPMNEQVLYASYLEAIDLIEDKAKLKGKLKEIADNIDEEDNPVVMIVTNKR